MKSIHWFSIIRIFLVLSMIAITTGCNGVKVKAELDEKTLKVLQNAIDMLGKQPFFWKDTLTSTIDELGKIGSDLAKEIRQQVQELVSSTVQITEQSLKCAVDFVAIRVKQLLQEIVYRYFPDRTDPPEFIPVICTIDPTHINATDDNFVYYSGFDIISFAKSGNFYVDLVYSDNGEIVKQNFGGVNEATDYLLVIDIQHHNYPPIDVNRFPQLVLRWTSKTVEGKSEVPVEMPEIPTPIIGQVITNIAPTPTFQGCRYIDSVSEETGEGWCPRGWAARGVKCEGSNCDNMSLYCCPYTNNIPDPDASESWTEWFSEENNNITWSGTGFVSGIDCYHDYCDWVALAILTTPHLVNKEPCTLLPNISEEGNNESICNDNEFIAGMRCSGNYCDNVSVYCCTAELH